MELGGKLALADLVRVAREPADVRLSPRARARAAEDNGLVRKTAASGVPAYGVTTGSGANVGVAIEPADVERFQVNLVTSHCVGVGSPLPHDTVRAMLALRAHGIGLGRTGADPGVAEAIVAFLNAGIHPIVPERGSAGMADLAQMAHAALPLLGLGEVEWRGRRTGAAEALAGAGLRPLRLGPRDGLTLTSSTAPTLAVATLAAEDAGSFLAAAEASAALAMEGFRAGLGALDERVLDGGSQPGPAAVAARLRAMLEGGELARAGGGPRVQDPLSFRCVPQVHGASADCLSALRSLLQAEIDSPADSPAVLLGPEPAIVSHGGFHLGRVAIAVEALGLALGQQALATAQRVFRLHSPRFTGFPAYLAPEPGVNCGFATLQKTMADLVSEVRRLAAPASLDGIAVAEGQEDLSVPALAAGRRLARILEPLGYLVACELLAAAQAVDLLGGPDRLGEGTARLHAEVRRLAPFLDADRPLTPEVERVAEWVRLSPG